MHVFRRVAAGTPHDDLLALLVPFQELPTHFRRHGDLALGRQLGLRDGHGGNYHGNGMSQARRLTGSARRALPSLVAPSQGAHSSPGGKVYRARAASSFLAASTRSLALTM